MHSFAWLPLLLVLLIATAAHLRWRCIPNRLAVTALLGGFAANIWQTGWRGFEISLAGFLVGGVTLGLFFLMGIVSTDEIRLCAAAGAWTGPAQMMLALVGAALAAALLLIGWAARSGLLTEQTNGSGSVASMHTSSMNDLPIAGSCRTMTFMPAIVLGILISFYAL